MTHVMAWAPDERRRRLASGADLHASERYEDAQPCSDLNISVRAVEQAASAIPRTDEMCSMRPDRVTVINLAAAFCVS